MSLSLAYLEKCSAETGYQVVPLEKVVRLGDLAAVGKRGGDVAGALNRSIYESVIVRHLFPGAVFPR